MKAALLLVTIFVSPARAGVAVSAEAGADAAVPRISLQTSLAPMSGPSLGTTLTPALNATLAAPTALTPQALPAPLPVSAVAAPAFAGAVAVQARIIPAAAATPEAPKTPAPEAAAAPADKTEAGAPSFKTKILGMLKSMANPFGGKASEEPAGEAQRLDQEFTKLDVWSQIAPSARAEIETMRARNLSKADFKEHVRSAGRAAMARMQTAAGTNNIGFHYNLHGGRREDYVGAGIRATMGDIALQYTIHGDRNFKVYFFQSAKHELYDLLDQSHPQQLLFPSRMGHALNMFDVDAPAILAAKAEGRIRDHGAISMDFHGMGGVPYSAYLAPPVDVFIGTAKKLGLKKLTRDEETLVTIRYLEAAAAAGRPYIPR